MHERRSRAERLRSALLWWTGIVLGVVIWHLVARSQPAYVLPSPQAAWEALLELIRSKRLGTALLLTIERGATGLGVSCLVGMPLGFLVVTYLAFPFAASLVLGIVALFFLAKTPKPFALFIFAALPGCLMALMGHTPVAAIHSLIIGALAELVRKALGYKTVKGSIAGYALMSLWFCGPFWQIYILKEQYYVMAEKMMGAEYATQLVSLPIWIMPLLYVSSFIGGLLGGLLGAKVLKKHFEKAGLV